MADPDTSAVPAVSKWRSYWRTNGWRNGSELWAATHLEPVWTLLRRLPVIRSATRPVVGRRVVNELAGNCRRLGGQGIMNPGQHLRGGAEPFPPQRVLGESLVRCSLSGAVTRRAAEEFQIGADIAGEVIAAAVGIARRPDLYRAIVRAAESIEVGLWVRVIADFAREIRAVALVDLLPKEGTHVAAGDRCGLCGAGDGLRGRPASTRDRTGMRYEPLGLPRPLTGAR